MTNDDDILARVRAARDFAYGEASRYFASVDNPSATATERLAESVALMAYRSITETLNVILGEPPATGLTIGDAH